MKFLKFVGKLFVFTTWLFNSLVLRGIVAVEAFAFLVMMPFMKHIGVTLGDHVQLVSAHRLGFMLGVPAVATLLSMARSHINWPLFSNWKLFAGLSVLVNFFTLTTMASLWPESVYVQVPYAIYCAGFMTAVSFFTSWLLKNSALTASPSWKEEQPS